MNELQRIRELFLYDSCPDPLVILTRYEIPELPENPQAGDVMPGNPEGINLDYKKCRDLIRETLDIQNFDTRSHDDKLLMARLFLVDKTKRLTMLTEDQEKRYSVKYNHSMRESRKNRILLFTSHIWNNEADPATLLNSYSPHFQSYVDGFDNLINLCEGEYQQILL